MAAGAETLILGALNTAHLRRGLALVEHGLFRLATVS